MMENKNQSNEKEPANSKIHDIAPKAVGGSGMGATNEAVDDVVKIVHESPAIPTADVDASLQKSMMTQHSATVADLVDEPAVETNNKSGHSLKINSTMQLVIVAAGVAVLLTMLGVLAIVTTGNDSSPEPSSQDSASSVKNETSDPAQTADNPSVQAIDVELQAIDDMLGTIEDSGDLNSQALTNEELGF